MISLSLFHWFPPYEWCFIYLSWLSACNTILTLGEVETVKSCLDCYGNVFCAPFIDDTNSVLPNCVTHYSAKTINSSMFICSPKSSFGVSSSGSSRSYLLFASKPSHLKLHLDPNHTNRAISHLWNKCTSFSTSSPQRQQVGSIALSPTAILSLSLSWILAFNSFF